MRITKRITKTFTMLLVTLMLMAWTSGGTSHATVLDPNHATPTLPNPVLYLMGTEAFTKGGKNYIRYQYDVLNKADYPDALFASAPALPPCGANTKSSRTWVDIFDQNGKRLYGFCAFSKAADLGKTWFALEAGVIPPSYIYIEMNDRQTNTIYKSNLADTTL